MTFRYVEAQMTLGSEYSLQFVPYNNAYLYKPSDPEVPVNECRTTK